MRPFKRMKMRYTVRKQGIGWVVYDNQTGETVDGYPSRSETRAKCREYNLQPLTPE